MIKITINSSETQLGCCGLTSPSSPISISVFSLWKGGKYCRLHHCHGNIKSIFTHKYFVGYHLLYSIKHKSFLGCDDSNDDLWINPSTRSGRAGWHWATGSLDLNMRLPPPQSSVFSSLAVSLGECGDSEHCHWGHSAPPAHGHGCQNLVIIMMILWVIVQHTFHPGLVSSLTWKTGMIQQTTRYPSPGEDHHCHHQDAHQHGDIAGPQGRASTLPSSFLWLPCPGLSIYQFLPTFAMDIDDHSKLPRPLITASRRLGLHRVLPLDLHVEYHKAAGIVVVILRCA